MTAPSTTETITEPAVAQPGATDASRTAGVPLGLAWAHLLGWVALAIINALVIALTVPLTASGGLSGRMSHHAYDLGHMLALGMLSHVAALGWERWAPGRVRRAAPILLGLVAFVVALGVMGDDLAGLLQRQSGHGGKLPWYIGACALAAMVTGALAYAARRLDRPGYRWIAVAPAVGLAVANHFMLQFNYPATHFFAAWIAALILGNALAGAAVPLRPRVSRRVGIAARVVVGAACLAAVSVPPRATVWQALFRTSGSVLAPLLARVQHSRDDGTRPLVIQGSPWFSDRSAVPPVPASHDRIVPEDAIVFLLTVDALRADVVKDGAHADQLPAIEALRRESVEFSLARAPSPSTITTAISMFTGKYYTGMYWTDIPSGPFKGAIMPHEDRSPRLAGLLEAGHVRTVHVAGLWGLAAELGVGVGFGEEFKTRRDYGPAAEVADLIMARLKRDPQGPQLYYAHFVDSHAPYDLAGTQGTEYERYLRELALVDKQLGRIRKMVEDAGLLDRSVFIVSADHGEAFGEHNTRYHAVTVYEEMVRIPLLIRVPGVSHRLVGEPVTLMDVGPTILDMYDLPTPGTFLGESLVPFLRGKNPHLSRPIAVDAGRRMQALYFDDGRKAIVDFKRNTKEVYDLQADPGETRNLVDEPGARASDQLRVLRTFFDAHAFRKEGYEPPWRQF